MEREMVSIQISQGCEELPPDAITDITWLLHVCGTFVVLGTSLDEVLIVDDSVFAATIQSFTGEPYSLEFQRRRIMAFSIERENGFSNILFLRRSFFTLFKVKPFEQIPIFIEELYFCRFFRQTEQRLGSPEQRPFFQEIIKPFLPQIKDAFTAAADGQRGTAERLWSITVAIDARLAEKIA